MSRLAIFLSFIMYAASVVSCIRSDDGKIGGNVLEPGDKLPVFAVRMSDGTVVSDRTLDGHVSCIVFFNTGCPDCRKALPSVQKLYDNYSETVEFVCIGRMERESDVSGYWDSCGYTLPFSAQETDDIYNLFARERIPRIYFIDENSVVRYVYDDRPVPDYDTLESSLKECL